MSRRKKAQAPEEDEPLLDISSLIDVCFLLLIYFMVTATIQPRESDLGLNLPTTASNSDSQTEIDPMFIEVKEDGSIVVNREEQMDQGAVGRRRNLPMLEDRLLIYKEGASAANTAPLVQVAVDSEAPHESVVDVLNCLVGLEITKVTFTDFANY
ncbi:ExbD/TolR family protein [Rubritalea marina]|uniref:ExbD/TolR family protein n=1 Tax=Rubritalea marina TaxID=361055 RepID=UPI0003711DCB|nr:biopolymer transporter ExbD [Rubritalea marina]